MDVFYCIATRRSCRKYKNMPVEQEKLEKIIEAGRFAPSGGNNQSTHFIAVSDKEILTELNFKVKNEFRKMEIQDIMYPSLKKTIALSQSDSYAFHYNAPVLVIVANKKGYANGLADSACAMQNMMLEANALDLGSCWINQLHWLDDNENIRQFMYKLGLEEQETVCASLAVGCPELLDRRIKERNGNKVTYVQ